VLRTFKFFIDFFYEKNLLNFYTKFKSPENLHEIAKRTLSMSFDVEISGQVHTKENPCANLLEIINLIK